MLLTEEESKTKWCPHARVFRDQSDAPACNRVWKPYASDGVDDVVMPVGSTCIASQCMAWRWGTKPSAWQKINDDLYIPIQYERGGFCGLAGKVE